MWLVCTIISFQKGGVNMALEYIVEELGYNMNDNVIKRCMERLAKVMKRKRTHEEYTIMVRKVINQA